MKLIKVLAFLLLVAPLAAVAAEPAPATPSVVISTSLGDITVALDPVAAPLSTENFLTYVRDGFYDETIFHRVIDGFMIQGGGFNKSMARKPTRDPITNEADNGKPNARGTIAMARTRDPHSATAQFYINHKDNVFLDHTGKNLRGWGYAVFGEVTAGMDIVDTIAATPTTRVNGMGDVPVTPVIINSVREVGAAASPTPAAAAPAAAEQKP